ncbi:MAG: alpha/beta hydrolase [Planctomycetes bacterium]|nr:alpha/beta hydrolase [Planctomycetota bacterium]
MVAFARTLAASGLGVVAYDAPAHGDSTGGRTDLPRAAEALRAVSDVLGPFEAAITHSFGGMVAALAVEGGRPLAGRVEFGSLVLVSPPARLGDLTHRFGSGVGLSVRTISAMQDHIARRTGRAVAEFDTGALLRGNVRRLLVIHDEDDREVPFANGRAVAEAAGGGLTATRRLGHRRVLAAPEVARAAAEFVLAAR